MVPFAFIKSAVVAVFTTGPRNAEITINYNDEYATTTAVSLKLFAAGANQVYITTVAGCGSGGTWQALSSPVAHTLTASNGTKTVYAKFRDSALNESACVNDTIELDNTPPTQPGVITLGATPSSLTESPTLTFADADDYQTWVVYYEAQLSDGGSPIGDIVRVAPGSSAGGLSLIAGNTYYMNVRAVDLVGNRGPWRLSPSWVAVAPGALTCAAPGALSGGICYFQSANSGEGCVTTCTGRGGVHPATTYLIGSTGVNANCTNALTALGMGSGSATDSSGSAAGCSKLNTSGRRRGIMTTDYSTGANSGSGSRRVCACADGSAAVAALTNIATLTAPSVNSQSVKLSWTRGGDGNMGFKIAYAAGAAPANCDAAQISSNNITLGFDSSGTASHIVTGLAPGTTYGFRVCVVGVASTNTGLTVSATTTTVSAAQAATAPTFVNATASAVIGTQNFSFNHTVSGANRYLFVHLQAPYGGPTATTVTYNGTPMVRVGTSGISGYGGSELWGLVAPSVGTAAVNIQLAAAPALSMTAVASTFEAVNQVTPYASLFAGVGTAPRVDQYLASADNELVVGFTNHWRIDNGDKLYSPTVTHRLTNTASYPQAVWTIPGESIVHLLISDRNSWWSARVLSLKPVP